MNLKSIHQYKVEGIRGEEIDFASFKGKKILVVNVASECGLTPQYAQLQGLYEQFSDKVVIIGFPANDFGAQEPGSDETIQTFCQVNFGVTFPLVRKTSVTGDNMHPVYQFLTQKELNGKADTEVTWNFQKYLLDEEGVLIRMFPPDTEPLDEHLTQALGLMFD